MEGVPLKGIFCTQPFLSPFASWPHKGSSCDARSAARHGLALGSQVMESASLALNPLKPFLLFVYLSYFVTATES
jgi:hypothetical protein